MIDKPSKFASRRALRLALASKVSSILSDRLDLSENETRMAADIAGVTIRLENVVKERLDMRLFISAALREYSEKEE